MAEAVASQTRLHPPAFTSAAYDVEVLREQVKDFGDLVEAMLEQNEKMKSELKQVKAERDRLKEENERLRGE